MKNRVGFDRYSFYEIQHLWRDIELFSLLEGVVAGLVEESRLWFAPSDEMAKKIAETIAGVFRSRCKYDTEHQTYIIDNLLRVHLHRTRSLGVVEVSPSRLESWGEAHFDLQREIDAALRPLGITPAPKPTSCAVFFRGKVIE